MSRATQKNHGIWLFLVTLFLIGATLGVSIYITKVKSNYTELHRRVTALERLGK